MPTRKTLFNDGSRFPNFGADQNGLYNKTGSAASGLLHRIGREIIGGDYVEGQLLPNEATMREKYAVSRTSLREAYGKLTAKGLISARPKVGTSVRTRDNWNMLDPEVLEWHLQTIPAEEIATDLYALRRMVEPSASEMAAERRTDTDMAEIDAALAAMKANVSNENQLVDADFQFHMAILNATKNPFINAFSALIRAAMISTFELSWRGAEIIKDQRLAQHGSVADAIRDQEPARARANMEKLLDDSINDVSGAING